MAFNIHEIFKALADCDIDYVVVGVPIPLASIPHLVEMKQAAGRPQDHEDIRALQQLAALGGGAGA